MDRFADERDMRILEKDKYTFFVLRHIIGGRCQLLLTDHERLIICFSHHPFPVWIWTPDDASEAEKARVYQVAKEHSLLNEGYRFNLKHDLAEYFMERAAAEGKHLSVAMNMLAYDCRCPVEPDRMAAGALHRCGMEDLEELVDFIDLFQRETGIDKNDRDSYRKDAEAFIRSGNTFFWKNEQGEYVASCKYAVDGMIASVNLVFTKPEERRKHYAETMVYQLTRQIARAGYLPMLYTDADYAASNACYEKIGYALQGELCTIG